jgi:hypothetical protein
MQDQMEMKVHGRGCRTVDPGLVRRLEAIVTKRTDEALHAQLGISYNTWRKLTAGHPIRASLLSRLELRLDALESDDQTELADR